MRTITCLRRLGAQPESLASQGGYDEAGGLAPWLIRELKRCHPSQLLPDVPAVTIMWKEWRKEMICLIRHCRTWTGVAFWSHSPPLDALPCDHPQRPWQVTSFLDSCMLPRAARGDMILHTPSIPYMMRGCLATQNSSTQNIPTPNKPLAGWLAGPRRNR